MNEQQKLCEKLEIAIWIAKSLFDRGKATGSSANLSFVHENNMYITATGTCFGKLKKEEFSKLSLSGEWMEGPQPSKEYPLHMKFYNKDANIKAVIHTHSVYATLWSCLEHDNTTSVIPEYTPYLRMKLGTVSLIPYAPPGTQELFDLFEMNMNERNGYLLKKHGSIVGAKDLMEAFCCIEELEEAAHIAWELEK